jgi:hypothetical protein
LILLVQINITKGNFSEDKTLKEQIGCRVEGYVKEIIEEIARKEFRTLGNTTEKLICERLRDLGYLDEDFKTVERET